MAHDFLGTFNSAQFGRFATFARTQLDLVNGRIQHLEAEKNRVGTVVFRYENATGGSPLSYEATPSNSYIAKLLAAYEVLGGNPFIDLRARLRGNPVFVVAGDEQVGPTLMSNGEPLGLKGYADAPSAVLSANSRAWVNETLRYRFDRLERKIRRALDYSDQLQLEIQQLNTIRAPAETAASFEFIASQIDQLLSDPTYRPSFNDSNQLNPLGNAPFASYEPPQVGGQSDPNRVSPNQVSTPQRGEGGLQTPGNVTRST